MGYIRVLRGQRHIPSKIDLQIVVSQPIPNPQHMKLYIKVIQSLITFNAQLNVALKYKKSKLLIMRMKVM